MKTFEDVRQLGLYLNECCSEELISDEGDTFWRCPRCQQLWCWDLESKIPSDAPIALVA
jgi:hypothetical protein